MTRCLKYVVIMMTLASGVQAAGAVTGAASQILSLCGNCQALLIGERHRQPESAALFLELVAQMLSRGDRLIVALEIAAARQEALNAVLAGARTPEGIAHPLIDSAAFQRLLVDLAALKRAHGEGLRVAAIDDLSSEMNRDAAMARHLQHHLATGGGNRVVALVGNLHTVRQMQWAKAAGRPLPYLAERLVSAKMDVASVMQDLGAVCGHLRRPVFYPLTHAQGLEALSRQLDMVNHHPAMDMRQASDGIVVWQCRE